MLIVYYNKISDRQWLHITFLTFTFHKSISRKSIYCTIFLFSINKIVKLILIRIFLFLTGQLPTKIYKNSSTVKYQIKRVPDDIVDKVNNNFVRFNLVSKAL